MEIQPDTYTSGARAQAPQPYELDAPSAVWYDTLDREKNINRTCPSAASGVLGATCQYVGGTRQEQDIHFYNPLDKFTTGDQALGVAAVTEEVSVTPL